MLFVPFHTIWHLWLLSVNALTFLYFISFNFFLLMLLSWRVLCYRRALAVKDFFFQIGLFCYTASGTLQTLVYFLLPAAKCRIAKCLYQIIHEFIKKMSSSIIGKSVRHHLKRNPKSVGTVLKDVIDNIFEAKIRRTRDM